MKPTAVVGRRVGAYILDYIVYYVLVGAVFFVLADKQSELAGQVLSGDLDPDATLYGNFTIGDDEYSVTGGKAAIWFLFTFIIGIGNFLILPWRTGGSVGKHMLGIRVVRDDGSGYAGFWRQFGRQFMFIVDGFPYIIPNLLGFTLMATTKDNKRVGDMVAGTVVVRKEYATTGAPVSTQPVGAGAPPMMGTASMPSVSPDMGWSPQPEPVAAAPSGVPADWYPDPHGQKRLRYWDGASWTEHTAD